VATTTVGVNVGGKSEKGDPNGEVTTWELERLIRRRPGHKRRTREEVTITYCADGWHSVMCETRLDDQWAIEPGGFDRDRFRAFHREHPVVWRVRIRWGHPVYTYWYCDPELPDEYRELVAPSA
jgi:hypothetical protein